MKENMEKILYNVLTSQTISSDGRYLFVSSNLYGDIASYNIEKITNCVENISSDDFSEPASIFRAEKPISLAFHRDFLIVGSACGLITGFSLNNGTIQKKAWTMNLPLNHDQYEANEVNDMWIDKANDSLYAVCGNSMYRCDLDEGKVVSEFKGHKDYIHSVRGNDNSLITASEDGTVKIWDIRDNKNPTFNIEPNKCPALQRKNLGKWIGSASISNEWIACGGATKLALYNLNHLNSKVPFQVFDSFPKEIHVTDFIETDSLLVGGECNLLIQYSLKGDMTSEITCSGPAIYSVAWQKSPQKNILTACGASNCIDVTTNFTYKDAALNFYKKEKV